MTCKSFICGVEGLALKDDERAFLKKEQPYGVILFARNIADPAQVKALTADIRAQLTHSFACILIDQEGGRVARMKPPHWRAYPPALELAGKPDAERAIYLNARLIAEELAAVGISVDCAPLADVLAPECHDIIGDRAFGRDGATVAKLAGAQAKGLLEGGILPVLKHIPGHGRATADSHEALPIVTTYLAELENSDFVPFRALKDIPLGMTAHIVYTALDKAQCATMSRTAIGFIRDDIGFDGLLMSDDLSMKALTGSYRERTEKTLAAGCDLALHCNGNMAEMAEVAAASIPLAGKALERAKRAASMLKKPKPADVPALLAEWKQLIAA